MVRLGAAVVVIAFTAASCSGSENLFVPVDEFATATSVPADVGDLVAEPSPPEVAAAPEILELPGLIVVSSETNMAVIRPNGAGVFEYNDGRRAFLPTWSADSQLIATSVADGTSADIILLDVRQPTQVRQTPVESAPFMYAWSDDGAYLATLGGHGPNTRLRIYDTEISLVISSVEDSSVYISWEPGGTDIVAHVGEMLLLVDGVTGEVLNEVADVGRSFLAADWVPGTREVLAISGDDGAQALVRINLDDSSVTTITDLGGPAAIEVSPDGTRVAISHFVAGAGDDRSAMTEVLDLATGDRTAVGDELSTWLEWSPDGTRLLTLATLVGEGMWRILEADGTVTEGATFSPSDAERQAYLGFGDQYVVSANRWSPDGKAFVFAGQVDAVEGVFVQNVDPLMAPVLVAQGDLASWSPG